MVHGKSRVRRSILLAAMTVFVFVFPLAAQEVDPDPDSPTPILISEPDSTRALTTLPSTSQLTSSSKIKSRRGALPTFVTRTESQIFAPEATADLFVSNIVLMEKEGASAFRIYAEDSAGHRYRFPVLDMQSVKGYDGVYRLTVRLRDEIGYYEPPQLGDLLVGVTWRGLASNRVKLGYGQTGGKIQDDPGAVPTPLSSVSTKTTKAAPAETNLVGYRWSGDRIRFLEQATFGPTVALDNRIRRIGLRTWLAEQLNAPYPSAAFPYPDVPLKPTNAPADCDNNQIDTVPDVPLTCFRDVYTQYLPQTWFYKEALYGDSQLRHRVTFALQQLWVISGVDTQQSSWMITYHQQLSKNAFGNWRQLMADVTLNPGMGNYLDMIRSTRTNPNENYPREILQLFNVGLFMLNQDGTLQTDGQGNPIPTYDQNVVNNFTKVFTGWRDCNIQGANCPNLIPGSPNYKDPMLLVTGSHDLTAKTLLTYSGSTTSNIAACTNCTTAANITTYANNSLNQALDNIYNHPNVAPFVSKYLIQQMVTSDPTPAYVGRVSAVFNANRSNPTQMKEVIKAILLDPEARGNTKTDPVYGKLREPVQLMTNVMRQVGVVSADGLSQTDGNINRYPQALAQDLFNSPTVFNYYPPTYIVPGTTLLGPEFAIMNTGTAIGRANFANSVVMTATPIAVSLPNSPNGMKLDIAELQSIAAADTTSARLLDTLNQRFMHGAMSASMRSQILTAVNTTASTDPAGRARVGLYLVVTSSQYQVQR